MNLRLAIGITAAIGAILLTPGSAAAERIPGIDVSRFQGRINWEQVAADEVEFAFVQASRGSGNDCLVVADRCGADEFYDRNYRRARQAGVRVGPYHRTFTGGEGPKGVRADAREEANVFLEEVGDDFRSGDLPPVLDFESPFNDLTPAELRRWARTWLVKVEKELGVKPLIYTNVTSWNRTGPTLRFAQQGYRLWVANWNVDRPQVPASNWSGYGWSVWQHSSTGRVSGISGNVDLNVSRVPLDALATEPEPPVPEPVRQEDETVWLCEPGVEPNPCRDSLETTVYSESGEARTESPEFPRRPKIDCPYVYPTASEDPGANSDLSIDPEHIAIAQYQAARFSQRCRVWAPMYRQATLASIAGAATTTTAAVWCSSATPRARRCSASSSGPRSTRSERRGGSSSRESSSAPT